MFLSSSTARRMNFISNRGSPSKYRTFSCRSRTSMSASRVLFWVTCSPSCGAILKRNRRAPGVGGREAHPHRRRLAVGGQRDVLRRHDAPVVFDVQRHVLAAVTGLRQHDVDDERGALEDGARRFDARHLDVAGEALLAEADREYRNRSRLEAVERFVERGVGRVGAVGDHDEAGERQAGELVARALERRPEPRGGAVVFQVRHRRQPVRPMNRN